MTFAAIGPSPSLRGDDSPLTLSAGTTESELLAILNEHVASFCQLDGRFTLSDSLYNAVVAHIHAMCTHLVELEARGIDREVLRGVVEPARQRQAEAPLIERIQKWPRGYAGDFETIEYILEGRNRATPNTLAFCCEQYVLNSAPAYQHRNKVALQAERIREACRDNPDPRILVVAAGSAFDVRSVLADIVRAQASVVINDVDDGAIAFCQEHLGTLGDRVSYVPGNVLVSSAALTTHDSYDLIVAGGLLDYVPANHARRLLRRLYRRLAHGGRLFFSNIAAGNPYRTWMEYFGNWLLVERREAEIGDLMSSIGSDAHTRIGRDLSGLTFVVDVVASGR